jgi:hypothetical protein
MRVTTLDPMTLNDVKDLDSAPFLIEGKGQNALKIYFESEASMLEYLDMESHGANGIGGLAEIFDSMADNPDTGSIN